MCFAEKNLKPTRTYRVYCPIQFPRVFSFLEFVQSGNDSDT